MYKIILIKIFFFCTFLGAKGQDKSILYVNFEDVKSVAQLNNSGLLYKYQSVHFDNVGSFENLGIGLERISQVTSIEKVVISGFNDKKIPGNLGGCRYIRSISFLNCKETNYKALFKELAEMETLEDLSFISSKIVIIPSEIRECTQLKSIDISLNSVLDLQGSIEALSACPNLERISLPVNQIAELPDNIGKLNNLKELNLANNNLTDLPVSMQKMDSLQYLTLQKNIFVSPVSTYGKLNTLNIKYLAIDRVSDEEMKELQRLFPNAIIEQEDIPDFEALEVHEELKDSIVREILLGRKEEEDRNHVIKKRMSTDVSVFSLAYLQYAKIFDPLLAKEQFQDTLFFDERFLDTNYYNVYRRQEGLDCDYFELKTISSKDNQIWFSFKMSEYFYSNFPEYFAFKNMIWAVVGNRQTNKDFKEEWIKGMQYTDFRLVYQSATKNFELQLKTNIGIKSLIVVPRFPEKRTPISTVQSSYEIRYVKYLEALDKRRKTFNKSQYEKTIAYRVKVNKLNQEAWEEFSKQYFSEEEQGLSQEEWLSYYDKVISNEKKALLGSEINVVFVKRYLDLEGFDEIIQVEEAQKRYGDQPVLCRFLDDDGNFVSTLELIVINHTDRSYRTYKGSNGPIDFNIFAREADQLSVIAVFRDRDFGILDRTSFLIWKQEENKRVSTLTRMSKDYADIYDIMAKTKLL